MAWYALRAAAKREHIAATVLSREAEVEAFCPRIRFTKKTRRGPVRFVEALFPGYLFVRADLSTHYRRLLASNGITGIVTYGSTVPQVPASFIDDLRERLPGDVHEAVEPAIREGQVVTILDGPFANWDAVVAGLVPARERVALLLDFLGRTIRIELSEARVLAQSERPQLRSFGAR